MSQGKHAPILLIGTMLKATILKSLIGKSR